MELTQSQYYIAVACHEANKVWCEANEDFSQKKQRIQQSAKFQSAMVSADAVKQEIADKISATADIQPTFVFSATLLHKTKSLIGCIDAVPPPPPLSDADKELLKR
jgi:hypothetical protein